jgi:hypothetical protein
MGTWGTALYSDDLAADLRADLRECFGDGLSPSAAVDKLISEYSSSLTDSDESPVFWLAIADTGWRFGRLDDRASAGSRDHRQWSRFDAVAGGV